MKNKKQLKIFIGILFFCFLFVGFFCAINNKVSALEVSYPVISGENLNTDTNLTLPKYVLYLFNAGVFLGFFAIFISLVIAGVMYILSAVSAEARAEAKDRIVGAISGLLILVLTYLIITTINPQLSVFNLNSLPETPATTVAKTTPGVYFYKSSGCPPEKNAEVSTSNVPDLGKLKNQVHSVGIIQDPNTESYYITILYNNPGLWGKCQYITTDSTATTTCKPVTPFASSASVYKYDFHPEENNPPDGGVYFYRKSYWNNSGGYYFVSNDEIKNAGIYVHALDNPDSTLIFTGVPEDEQDCVGYDKDGTCISRTPPTLGGENISSVGIDGNYLVLFVYAKPGDDPIWSDCQEFPTTDDINKTGPQQIKWKSIRNNNGVIPNWVIIIPIQR